MKEHTIGRLLTAASLTFILFVAEVVGGIFSNSLSLLSDAGHMLTDLSAILLIGFALHWSAKPASSQKTFGYSRLEILATLINGGLLFFVAFQIFWEAAKRFAQPHSVNVRVMLPVATVGLIVNLVSLILLHRQRHNLGIRSALAHIAADSISSVGVIFAGLVIAKTGWYFVDTLVSLLIVIAIGWSSYKLLKESINILLEGIPAGISVDQVLATIAKVPGVKDIHDLHVWTIGSGYLACSMHIGVQNMHTHESDLLISDIAKRLEKDFQITHTTIQVETRAKPVPIQPFGVRV